MIWLTTIATAYIYTVTVCHSDIHTHRNSHKQVLREREGGGEIERKSKQREREGGGRDRGGIERGGGRDREREEGERGGGREGERERDPT